MGMVNRPLVSPWNEAKAISGPSCTCHAACRIWILICQCFPLNCLGKIPGVIYDSPIYIYRLRKIYGFKGCRWKALNQKRSHDAHRPEIFSSHSEAWDFFHLRFFLHSDIHWHDIGFAWLSQNVKSQEKIKRQSFISMKCLKICVCWPDCAVSKPLQTKGPIFHCKILQSKPGNLSIPYPMMYKVPVEKWSYKQWKWLMRTWGIVKHL